MVLQVRGLCRAVLHEGEERVLLDEVSLTVAPGSAIGVTGPSGAGKSTLLRLIMGLEERSGGSVALDGREVPAWDPPSLRARVALVPQEVPALEGTPGSTARRVQGFRLHRNRRWDPGRSLEAALGDLGLDTGLASRPWSELSGGERRRAFLAVATLLEPDYLLLDEPTSGLDREAARRVAALVRRFVDRGGGALVASHDEVLLARTVVFLLVLYDGALHAEGAPAEVIPSAAAEVRREREARALP